MRWQIDANPADGKVTYTVTAADACRWGLRDLGFLVYDNPRRWILTVSTSDVARIGRVESFLRDSQKNLSAGKRPSTSGGPHQTVAPPGCSSRTINRPALDLIDGLLRDKSWLTQAELKFLNDVRSQIRGGRPLSDRQLSWLTSLPEKVHWRKYPGPYRGGSPGQGRKRR